MAKKYFYKKSLATLIEEQTKTLEKLLLSQKQKIFTTRKIVADPEPTITYTNEDVILDADSDYVYIPKDLSTEKTTLIVSSDKIELDTNSIEKLKKKKGLSLGKN